VRVACLAGLALLKIVAWDARRFERDAEDLGLIMRNYLDAGNQDRIYGDYGDCLDLLNEEFDYDKASARILGRDIGRLLTNTSRMVVDRALSAETLAMVMVRNIASYYGDYDHAMGILAELRTGISDP
jgi:predicted nucleotidyltransferase